MGKYCLNIFGKGIVGKYWVVHNLLVNVEQMMEANIRGAQLFFSKVMAGARGWGGILLTPDLWWSVAFLCAARRSGALWDARGHSRALWSSGGRAGAL